MVLFPENIFSALIVKLLAKVGKIRKYDEERVFERKCFHLLKRHLCQNGRAEFVLVVAGRLGNIQMVFDVSNIEPEGNGCLYH